MTTPRRPVRLLHLGLGNFFRAHQAWYTDHSSDHDGWGYAAFAGRTADLAERMARQGDWFTLVTRGATGDGYEVIESVARSHRADETSAWLDYFGSPEVALVTLTVTEAGYAGSVPERLVAGLDARRRAGAGPLAVVPCDNMAGNGLVAARAVTDLAERSDPSLAEWIAAHVSFVSTTVDRITPRPTADDAADVFTATGRRDECPVVTEPFSEWVLAGDFPAGRPRWEGAGATFTSDVTPYENRKLWLLNGAHSLLAYAGSLRGHAAVSDAIGDDTCRGWIEQWWAVAGPHLAQPGEVVDPYCRALLERWANQRIRHQLAQIAADGSQKLPIRVLPVLRAERAAGRIPLAATRILAAWICHLQRKGAPISDVRAEEFTAAASAGPGEASRGVLRLLDPELAEDVELVRVVADQARELAAVQR